MNKRKRKAIKNGQKRKSKKNGLKPEKVFDRDVFENSLRMTPNRIILGEFRGEKASELLQATGRIF
jgi:Flp pilus assembly CpaF family ATPase